MIVNRLRRFLNLLEWILEGQRKKVRFEKELKGIALDVELTSPDLDIGHSNVDNYVSIVLFELEIRYNHEYIINLNATKSSMVIRKLVMVIRKSSMTMIIRKNKSICWVKFYYKKYPQY